MENNVLMHFKAQPFKLHVCKTHGGKFRFQRFFSITKPKVTYSNVLNILKHSDHIVSYSILMANNCKIYAFMLKKKMTQMLLFIYLQTIADTNFCRSIF